MGDPNREAKLGFIEAFFDDLDDKIAFLRGLRERGRADEAFLLCCCYIDGLGNSLFPGERSSKRCFVRVLERHGGEEVLALIHPKILCESLAEMGKHARAVLGQVRSPLRDAEGAVYTRAEMLAMLRSNLSDADRSWLEDNLWRGTLAVLAYRTIRSPFVHGLGGPGGISFDQTTYQGRPVPSIDFDLLYRCLPRIAQAARNISVRTVAWFGHDFDVDGS